MSVAVSTRALIIGISNYADSTLQLGFASANAEAVAEALCLTDGCAIPTENVVLLLDGKASRVEILNCLSQAATSCLADDIFLVYFSGHGEATDQIFSLLPADVSLDELVDTSVGAGEIQGVLGQCVARGIVLILDCCKSAGFAENASQFFVTLGGREFRLLLSASRAGQLSYEFSATRGTLFTDGLVRLLRGEAIIGDTPGAIYFADLFEYLQLQVAEGLELQGHPTTLQEPVFAGTYARDPLLFLLRNLSLQRLESETPRYSRRFLRARIRQTLAVLAGAFLAVLALYYMYLDHAQYVWQETEIVADDPREFLSIYQGNPRLNWLGFPHRVLTLDIRSDSLDSSVRPGVGRPLTASWGASVEEPVRMALNHEWRTALHVWEGDQAAAWKSAKEINVFDNPNLSGADQAAEALAEVSTAADLARYDELLGPEASASTPTLLRRMAELAPEQAVSMLGDNFDEPENRLAILQGIGNNCSSDVTHFLRETAIKANGNSYWHNAWFGAAWRSHCRLGIPTLLNAAAPKTIWDRGLDWLPLLLAEDQIEIRKATQTALTGSLVKVRSGKLERDELYNESLRAWMLLRTAAILDLDIVPDAAWDVLDSTYKHLRYAAALALTGRRHPGDLDRLLHHVRDPWILAALIESGWFDGKVALEAILPLANQSLPGQGKRTDGSVIFILERIRLRKVFGAIDFVRRIQMSFTAAEVQIEALRTLQTLSNSSLSQGYTVPADILNYVGSFPLSSFSRFGLGRGTYAWVIRNDSSAFRDALATLGDDANDAADLLGRAVLPQAVLDQLESRVSTAPDGLRATAIVAMRGSTLQLMRLLQSPDINIRHEAEEYAAYNPHLNEILDNPLIKRFGTRTHFVLARQARLRKMLAAQYETAPAHLRSIVVGIASLSRSDISNGVIDWLRDQAGDDGDGPLAGWLDELYFDNSPGPLKAN